MQVKIGKIKFNIGFRLEHFLFFFNIKYIVQEREREGERERKEKAKSN